PRWGSGACGYEGLDRPSGRRAVGTAARRELEAPVGIVEPAQVPKGPANRRTSDAGRTESLYGRGRVVRVGRAAREPGPAAVPGLAAEDVPDGSPRRPLAGLAQGEHAPDGRVDGRPDLPALPSSAANPS